MTDARVAAVVLAAGAGTRFGGPKQERLLPLVLSRLAQTGVEEIVVVLGAYRFPVEGARVVTAEDWDRGPGASLRAGLAALPSETKAAVVCLADGPLLAPAAVDRLLAAWRAGEGEALAASYDGMRGHPVVLGCSVWGSIPDEGARALQVTLVPCDELGSPEDVDTRDDLRRLEPLL
jgi:CTP:molybdopterin cytidylyltransferase MocA